MFGFKDKKLADKDHSKIKGSEASAMAPSASEVDGTMEKQGLFGRLRLGLSKTNKLIREDIGAILRGKIDDDVLEDLETRLLMADVGVEATQEIIDQLHAGMKRRQMSDTTAVLTMLHRQMTEILAPCNRPLSISEIHQPFVILVVGVNGVGKTTTIGKLAKKLQQQGQSVILAAGDTFRAAAVEQLQSWGARNNIPVVSQGQGADSASVIFDTLQAARARKIDVMIADTAGRLHTQGNLMEELSKVRRVLKKLDNTAPHETMLVVDAGTGQNALNQAQQFHRAIELTGITITKLDGTAKGGIIFAIANKMKIPIRFVGIGEAVEDLRVFEAHEFVSALLGQESP